MGLIVAGAYLGGSLASAAQPNITAPQPVLVAHTVSQATAAPSIPATVRNQGVRSSELLKASFAGPAAAPFQAARSDRDLECLTDAVYYEARGEGRAGQAAVAQVVLNRVRHPAFPKSICGVVFQGCQFSFACNGAMRARHETGAWNRAQRVAAEALSGAVAANVGNATHFHTVNVAPNWPNLMRVGQVGLHVFYRFGGRSGRSSAFTAQPRPSTGDAPALGSGLTYARYTPPMTTPDVQLTSGQPQPALQVAEAGTPVVSPSAKPQELAAAPATTAPAAEAAPQPTEAVKISADRPATPTSATAS